MKLHIRNGRLVDPTQRLDESADLWVEDGVVRAVSKPGGKPAVRPDRELDTGGNMIAPGFIDLHVHLREPGQTHKEDMESGTRAAVAGGFTSVLCMPNTDPANDSPDVTKLILRRAKEVAHCRVYPVGAVSLNLEGKILSPLSELKKAGCVAFSDDGRPCSDPVLLRQALTASKSLDVPIIQHCEELSLSGHPTIHDGAVAKKMGLQGVPVSAETVDLARTAVLASEIGARLHLAHVSCRESVELLAGFKRRCRDLTAEVTPHHLVLTDGAVERHGTNAKMYPPLRREEDCLALQKALSGGTIDAVATDHAPHTEEEKARPFTEAPNGVIGLETALPVLLALVEKGSLSLSRLVEVLSTAPARIAGIRGGSLKVGMPADIVVFSLGEKRKFSPEEFHSKSRNTPFIGFEGKGRVLYTFVGGKQVFGEPL